MLIISVLPIFFFFNDTATTEIYTLSLHDALPISRHGRRHVADREGRARGRRGRGQGARAQAAPGGVHARRLPQAAQDGPPDGDRKSTRLNSSHANISYAVFCLKKKNIQS